MKKIIIFFFLLISFKGYCQINFASDEDFKAFSQTKTLVVLNNNPFSSYNENIKAAVEKLWKITPYTFISQKEFDTKKNNKVFSFLLLTDASSVLKDVIMQYNFLNLVLGGKASNLNEMPDLGSIPISYLDEDENNYLPKISAVLIFIQYYVNYNLSHPNTDLMALLKKTGWKYRKQRSMANTGRR